MPTLTQRLIASHGAPHPSSRAYGALRNGGVQDTEEFRRIVAIPRRAANEEILDLTPVFRRPGGTMKLWPSQSQALFEAEAANGLFAPMACGSGKTAVSCLLPEALQSKKAVLLIPPQLKRQLLDHDLAFYGQHFNLPLDVLHVVSYSELSTAGHAGVLEQLQPDLIIADEVHNLRSADAARTKRFMRYFSEHPKTRFAGMSGTITAASIRDYEHLIRLALRHNSPLPTGYYELKTWADALDVSEDPYPPGVLIQLVEPQDNVPTIVNRTSDLQPAIRRAYRRRLVDTTGVVSTGAEEVGSSLVIRFLSPEVPDVINESLDALWANWAIGEEEFAEPSDVARVARQLAAGFYYRWVWPKGKDVAWLKARSEWTKEVRDFLRRSIEGLDSPMLVERAHEDGRLGFDSWAAWRTERGKPLPPTEPVWLSDFLVQECKSWAGYSSPGFPGVIWYKYGAFGEHLARATGLPWYGPGEAASAAILKAAPDKQPCIVASIAAHGTGKNLQTYSTALLTSCPSGNAVFEQVLARLHRPGQRSDEVTFDVFQHTKDLRSAFANALIEARYVEETTGVKQKILLATKVEY